MEVLYEDNHVIIVNKSCSEIVQGDKTGDQPLSEIVKEWLRNKYNKPGNVFCGVVHRLDRPTSGIVLFAKTSKALSRMNELFRTGEVQKCYWAIVCNRPELPTARLEHYLLRREKLNKSFAYDKPIDDSKQASLTYTLRASSDNYHMVEVDLHTGRHHQIRCQMAQIGCPVKGDLKYGAARSNPDGGISLHARSIRFIHPVSNEVVYVVAPVPNDRLWNYFETQIDQP